MQTQEGKLVSESIIKGFFFPPENLFENFEVVLTYKRTEEK